MNDMNHDDFHCEESGPSCSLNQCTAHWKTHISFLGPGDYPTQLSVCCQWNSDTSYSLVCEDSSKVQGTPFWIRQVTNPGPPMTTSHILCLADGACCSGGPVTDGAQFQDGQDTAGGYWLCRSMSSCACAVTMHKMVEGEAAHVAQKMEMNWSVRSYSKESVDMYTICTPEGVMPFRYLALGDCGRLVVVTPGVSNEPQPKQGIFSLRL